jgi:aldehyde:ferredoxin oxidoreductase
VERVGSGEVEVGPAAARWVPVAVRIAPDAAARAGAGAHRVDFRITQLAAAGQAERQLDERSTFLIPR